MDNGGKPGGTWGVGRGAVMGATSGKSSYRKMSKLLVRHDEVEKRKSA
jgi:hypothetical protein